VEWGCASTQTQSKQGANARRAEFNGGFFLADWLLRQLCWDCGHVAHVRVAVFQATASTLLLSQGEEKPTPANEDFWTQVAPRASKTTSRLKKKRPLTSQRI